MEMTSRHEVFSRRYVGNSRIIRYYLDRVKVDYGNNNRRIIELDMDLHVLLLQILYVLISIQKVSL